MQKILNKFIAVVLIAILVGFNCMTTAAYAADIIEQNNETSEKNITFNSTIGNETSHNGYEYTADIDSTDTYLYLDIGVKNTGYLKNISINLANSNYKFDYSKVDNKIVKSISDYSLELNQINTAETVELAIPIIPTMSERISQYELGKDSTVKFTASYVNEDNKEDTLEKEMTVRLNWTTSEENLVGELSQNVIRYLNYDGKTMVSFLLSDALKDSKLPVGSKQIKVNVPEINELKPAQVIVTAIDTIATNGDQNGVNFTEDNYSYDSESGELTINVENTLGEDGLVSWIRGASDRFVITYIYETNTNEEPITIHTETETTTTLLNGNTVTAQMEQQDYELDAKIGDIATIEVIPDNTTLNKGYMYSNKDKESDQIETTFGVKYRLNVGLAEALNEIKIQENGDFLGNVNASNFIYDKKVSVSHDELVKVLGEDGKIDVIKSDGTVIGTLNKDTLELEINDSNISFVTSKPITEGEINLEVSKAIKGNLDYSKDEISNFTTLNVKAQINGESTGTITLEEPTSKATLQISNQNLSTVVENENVVMNITLERDDITDNLFANPEVDVTLPDEVTSIEIKDATLLYDDELVSESFYVEGHTIKLKFNGKQTKYNEQSTAKGTVIRLVLDLTLNNLAPSRQTNILLSYTNDNDVYTSTAENGIATLSEEGTNVQTVEVPVNVVAPTGFVTTQTMTGYNEDESVTSQQEEEIGTLPVLSDAKTATVSGVVVNNLGADAEGLVILGRIPFTGNKQVDGGEELGTTFDTTLAGAVNFEGIEGTVYYSSNGEATTDVEDEANGWTEEYSSEAKSYMIVATGTVANGTTINFNYRINIPANVDYANTAKASYGVYYNNNAEQGTSKNVILATPVGIKTVEKAELSINISAHYTNTNETIQPNGNIKEGDYITYDIAVTNTSNENAENTKVSVELPLGFSRLISESIENFPDMPLIYDKDYTSPYEIDLGTINSGQTRNLSLSLVAGKIISTAETQERTIRATATADRMDGEAVGVFTSYLEEGYVTGLLTVTYENHNVNQDTILEYSLSIQNVNNDNTTNVVANMILPEGLEYISSSSSNGEFNGEYNENTREVTFNIGTLEGRDNIGLTIQAKVLDSSNNNLSTRASIACDETDAEFLTNTVTVFYGQSSVEANFSSNITQGTLLDTDTLEYYIDVKNTGSIPVRVNIANQTPDGLINNSYSIEVSNGTRRDIDNFSSNYISEIVELEVGGTARLTITAKPISIASGSSLEVTDTPEVSILYEDSDNVAEEVSINSLTHTIQGTGGSNTPGVNGRFRITGTAWIDTNKDGIKDTVEPRFSNIQMTLYDTQGNVARDSNGNELRTTTNEDGQYSFENLNSGDYQIVAQIDTVNYMVTTYKLSGAVESQNSDFVDATLDGTAVAATDILNLTTYNLYNIDLGLQEREQFDLRLDKRITKITVTNTRLDPQEYEYDTNFAMVSLLNTYVEYATVLIEYTMTITNEGKVAGYAKELVDYMPEGMAFSSDLNTNWYVGTDGNIYSTSLANTLIQPGETKTIRLVLTRRMTGENTGTVVNTAEISQTYNEYGLDDGDSTPGNRQDGEDDISTATTLITMGTGREVASFLGITLGIIAIVGLAVFLIKKYVIRRI